MIVVHPWQLDEPTDVSVIAGNGVASISGHVRPQSEAWILEEPGIRIEHAVAVELLASWARDDLRGAQVGF